MVLDAIPNRKEMGANGSNAKIHTSFQQARAVEKGGSASLSLSSSHTPKPPNSTHSELPIFTIFYNKYSDVIL